MADYNTEKMEKLRTFAEYILSKCNSMKYVLVAGFGDDAYPHKVTFECTKTYDEIINKMFQHEIEVWKAEDFVSDAESWVYQTFSTWSWLPGHICRHSFAESGGISFTNDYYVYSKESVSFEELCANEYVRKTQMYGRMLVDQAQAEAAKQCAASGQKFACIDGYRDDARETTVHCVDTLDQAFTKMFELERSSKLDPYKTYRGDKDAYTCLDNAVNHRFADDEGYVRDYLIYFVNKPVFKHTEGVDEYGDTWEENYDIVRTDYFRAQEAQFSALCGQLGMATPGGKMYVDPEPAIF